MDYNEIQVRLCKEGSVETLEVKLSPRSAKVIWKEIVARLVKASHRFDNATKTK